MHIKLSLSTADLSKNIPGQGWRVIEGDMNHGAFYSTMKNGTWYAVGNYYKTGWGALSAAKRYVTEGTIL